MSALTEADVRRIVREEIAAHSQRMASALRRVNMFSDRTDRVPESSDLEVQNVRLFGDAVGDDVLQVDNTVVQLDDCLGQRAHGSPSVGDPGAGTPVVVTPTVGAVPGAVAPPAPGATPGGAS